MQTALRSLLLCSGVVFLLGFQSASASHLVVVDQENQPPYNAFSGAAGIGEGVGQSFTPTLTSLNAAEFTLKASFDTVGSPVTVRLDLFAGAGYSGLLLGSSAPVTFSGPDYQLVEFLFGSSIALTPESIYTLRIVVTAGDGYNVAGTSGNVYTRGAFFSSNGSAGAPGVDLGFAEGTAPVPEPATSVLVAVAGALLVWKRRNGANRQR